jgi:hypothetical protein
VAAPIAPASFAWRAFSKRWDDRPGLRLLKKERIIRTPRSKRALLSKSAGINDVEEDPPYKLSPAQGNSPSYKTCFV